MSSGRCRSHSSRSRRTASCRPIPPPNRNDTPIHHQVIGVSLRFGNPDQHQVAVRRSRSRAACGSAIPITSKLRLGHPPHKQVAARHQHHPHRAVRRPKLKRQCATTGQPASNRQRTTSARQQAAPRSAQSPHQVKPRQGRRFSQPIADMTGIGNCEDESLPVAFVTRRQCDCVHSKYSGRKGPCPGVVRVLA